MNNNCEATGYKRLTIRDIGVCEDCKKAIAYAKKLMEQ